MQYFHSTGLEEEVYFQDHQIPGFTCVDFYFLPRLKDILFQVLPITGQARHGKQDLKCNQHPTTIAEIKAAQFFHAKEASAGHRIGLASGIFRRLGILSKKVVMQVIHYWPSFSKDGFSYTPSSQPLHWGLSLHVEFFF